MHIEIRQPQLEALINQRMATGLFQNIEDLLMQTLESAAQINSEPVAGVPQQSIGQFLRESPIWGSGLTTERQKDSPRPVDL